MASSRAVAIKLNPRARGGKNDLHIVFANARQAHVYMAPPLGIQSANAVVDWTVSAWGEVSDPTLFDGTLVVTFAPSRLRIPPPRGFTLAFSLYLPPVPTWTAVGFRFVAEVDEATTTTLAYGFSDDTPTDYTGLHLAPFGLGSERAGPLDLPERDFL